MNMNRDFWKCPKCGREFSKKNQWHSCVLFSVEDHFKNKAQKLKKIFDFVQREIKKFGEIRIDAVKTSINFGGKSHFCVIFVLKNYLKLEFVLNKRIKNSRIIRVRGPTNKLFTYTIRLEKLEDVDEILINWLRESYNMRNL